MIKLKYPIMRKLGYKEENSFFEDMSNIAWALTFAIPSMPIILFLFILLPIVQGRPVIYKQKRLGQNKKPFTLYKFRTFEKERKIDKVYDPEEGGLTVLGPFLRKSRLDELPQLLNILKRDMNFFGPRPVRKEIAERYKDIKDYDIRFEVKPGLFGLAQMLIPHNGPKRYRAFINSSLCRRKNKSILAKFALLIAFFLSLFSKISKSRPEIRIQQGSVEEPVELESLIKLKASKNLHTGPAVLINHKRAKIVLKRRIGQIWIIEPVRQVDQYIISKYFLQDSLL